MKNKIAIIATIFITGFTHAAILDWGLKVPNTATKTYDGLTVYALSAAPDKVTALSDIESKLFTDIDVTKGTSTSKKIITSGPVAATADNSITLTDSQLSNGGTINYYLALFVTVEGKSYYWISDVQTGIGRITTTPSTKPMFDSTKILDGTLGGKGWTEVGAVPEPTTLALLALGIAALGLKRKV